MRWAACALKLSANDEQVCLGYYGEKTCKIEASLQEKLLELGEVTTRNIISYRLSVILEVEKATI
jgi:hypothetical protein